MKTQTIIEIQRTAHEVFAYLADFENNPAWQGGMNSCEWTSEGELRVGSTYTQEASFLGKAILTTFEVTADVQGKPPWYFRLPGMAGMVARSVKGDYARLKELLENPPEP